MFRIWMQMLFKEDEKHQRKPSFFPLAKKALFHPSVIRRKNIVAMVVN